MNNLAVFQIIPVDRHHLNQFTKIANSADFFQHPTISEGVDQGHGIDGFSFIVKIQHRFINFFMSSPIKIMG
jgi:hypothetical protein